MVFSHVPKFIMQDMQNSGYKSDVALLLQLADELLKAALVLGKACSQDEVSHVLLALPKAAGLCSVQASQAWSAAHRGRNAVAHQRAAHCQARHKCADAQHCDPKQDCGQVAGGASGQRPAKQSTGSIKP